MQHMLAVLFIEMEWMKESRTSAAAAFRQPYYKPVRIEDGVKLSGEGVFLKKCSYYQQGDCIVSSQEISHQLDKRLYEENKGKAFTKSDEREQRLAMLRAKRVQLEQGSFWDMDKIDIPCITILEEANHSFRIKWFDYEKGMPRRRGGNEDFYKKGAKLGGKCNILNETAFILEEGKAGVLKYNYRYTSYEGQWYKCFYTYIVYAKALTQDIFFREYDYEYNQLADLF